VIEGGIVPKKEDTPGKPCKRDHNGGGKDLQQNEGKAIIELGQSFQKDVIKRVKKGITNKKRKGKGAHPGLLECMTEVRSLSREGGSSAVEEIRRGKSKDFPTCLRNAGGKYRAGLTTTASEGYREKREGKAGR